MATAAGSPNERDSTAAAGRGPRRSFGRLLLGLTERLRGSRVLRRLAELEAAAAVSREEILRDQFRRLRALLTHAERHVPYYREMFRGLGITARDIRTLDDFARLPVLTKDIVRERLTDLVRDDVPRASLVKRHSGGSTGVPLTFFVDRDYLDVADAGIYRYLKQCGWQPGEMVAYFWGGNDELDRMPRWEFEVRQRLRRMYQFDPFHSGPRDMDQWRVRWPAIGATVALGYASTIARFAEFLEATGDRPSPIRGVFTTAERLYPKQRQLIAQVFGCPVFDCYGSSEVRNIAVECRRGRMHINADFVVVETAGPSTAGPSPFIVTSLRNFAMPFIRYGNEDCGALAEDSCDCGNQSPLLRLGIARIADNFTMPDGRVVHGEYFTHLMYGADGVESFQFHQTARDAITLWVVPGPGAPAGRERTIRHVVDRVRELGVGRVRVEVREVATIPLTPSGKHRFTRSDVTA
jgi:phenylacetate-CoA ligase